MWAFAVWDRADRRLQLVRDRLGMKPLYYGTLHNTFLFGSELKALRVHPRFDADIDRDALARYSALLVRPRPVVDLRRHPQASPRHLPDDRCRDRCAPRSPSRTGPPSTRSRSRVHQSPATTSSSKSSHALLRDAVQMRMISDVPLGAFLSGGIDSSIVVALMQEHSPEPVRTFTIGSTSRTHNEADVAHEVARVLGTRHTELVVTAEDALAVIPHLGTMYDEPFADSSQIPTYLVAQLARRDVTVSLSGDGGDELFGGYDRYRWLPRTARRFQKVPASARRALAKGLLAVPPRAVDLAVRPLPARHRPRIPSVKLAKFASIAQLDNPAAMYAELVTHWNEPESVVVGARSVDTLVDHAEEWPQVGGLENLLMALDTRTYLPDDILVKLDRATMAVGLEGRVPLLDHRVVEWAAALPPKAKIVHGEGKHLLRRILRGYVPDEVVDRPKTGFGVPLGEWLRGQLRPWAEELLSPSRLADESYLRPEPVLTMWSEHQSGRRDWEYHLWDVLMFQSWLEAAAPATQVTEPA